MKIYDHITSMIAQSGHAIIATDDGHRSFAYTIGLTEQDLPEVIIFGMNQQYAGFYLNEAARIMKEQGAFADGSVNNDLSHLPCGFKEVSAEQAEGYALQALYRYEDCPVPPKFIQMVVPDREGKLPWDEGYDAAHMGKFQPLLWER